MTGAGTRPPLLPADIASLIGDAFVRSCVLYDDYVFRLTLDVFRRAGLATVCAQPVTTDEASERAGMDSRVAHGALDWMLRTLTAHGVLQTTEEGGRVCYRLHGDIPELDPAAVREAQVRHDPAALPSYTIATLAAEHYPDVLRGETTGEGVLFGPDRIGAWADYFSNDNPLYAINNAIAALACDAALPAGCGSILELGGGLGSGASTLLARLRAKGRSAEVGSYRFTELAIPFLKRAQRTLTTSFPEFPLTFARLDMNEPFARAGVAPGAYALVHGVNTLHVANDLASTLGEIRTALSPKGSVVITECVRPLPGQPVTLEFVFNLLEVFHGFLTPEQWSAALEANGFRDVRVIPDIAAIRDVYPSFVVAAIVASKA